MLTSRVPENKTAGSIIDHLWCVSDPEASGFEALLPSGRCQIIFSLAGMSLLDGASGGGPLAVFQGPSTTVRRIPRRPQQSRVPQSVGQLRFGFCDAKGFGCHPRRKSIK